MMSTIEKEQNGLLASTRRFSISTNDDNGKCGGADTGVHEHESRRVYGSTGKVIVDTECGGHDDVNDDDNGSVERSDDLLSTIASVSGNVLEWYDFAIYGYFSDILGQKFFPPSEDASVALGKSFLVFGGAFLVRPVGGVVMGYIGDKVSRKRALELSIFLMAFPTFAMGCLPTYDAVGWWATAALVAVRLMQGLSAGGQMMSSMVFVTEGHPKEQRGWYASLAMMAGNSGSFLGGLVGYGMRHFLSYEQLLNGGWRIPFLCGIFASLFGFYIKNHVKEHKKIVASDDTLEVLNSKIYITNGCSDDSKSHRLPPTPLEMALSKRLRGSLLSATAAVVLWAGGYYTIFVWLVMFMNDVVEPPVPHAFAINAASLLLCTVLLFPFAGRASDVYGRVPIMTIGASGIAIGAPAAIRYVADGADGGVQSVLCVQMALGACLTLYAAPMCAWLVESFPAEARLTSVSIGYNVAMAAAGGMSPSAAMLLVEKYGPAGPGYMLSGFALVSLLGIHLAPKHGEYS